MSFIQYSCGSLLGLTGSGHTNPWEFAHGFAWRGDLGYLPSVAWIVGRSGRCGRSGREGTVVSSAPA